MGDGEISRAEPEPGTTALVSAPVRWVRGWALWTMPPSVRSYVLVVDALGLAAAGATAALLPVNAADWQRFGVLAVCAAVHIEASRTIERHREVASGTGPYVDLKSVWNFAGLLVLPPALASLLVAFTFVFSYLRIRSRHHPIAAFRWTFTCATVLLASEAAAAVLAATHLGYPGIPHGVLGIGAIAAAALLRWGVNYALVVGAIMLAAPETRARQALGPFGKQLVEAGALGLAITAAGLVLYQPLLLVGVLVALLALHRSVLMDQFQRAARTDAKTGLHCADWWRTLAEQELVKARHHDQELALLIADLDHFKQVNDRLGHFAGDQVLRAVARGIAGDVREETDTVGRLGGEEFGVLLPRTTTNAAQAIAERVRYQVGDLEVDVTAHDRGTETVRDLAVSIGIAVYPRDGTTLDELLLAADGALYAAKNAGRDQVRLAGATPGTALPAPHRFTRPPADIPEQAHAAPSGSPAAGADDRR